MIYYLKLLFFPINLCAYYLMFPVRTSPFDPYVVGAFLIVLTFLAIAVFSFFKGWKALSFSLGWFFITLLPVSNLVPIKIIIAERFLYGPSIGIFIGSAIVLSEIGKGIKEGGRMAPSLIALLIAIMLASMTVDRNRVWMDEHVFWLGIAEKSPGNTRAWHNIATIFQNKRMLIEAATHYKTALMMDYHSPETHYRLGKVYYLLHDEESALKEFFEALKDDPANSDINYEIGFLLSKKGFHSEAISYYRKALQGDPEHMNALYNLGMLYMQDQEYALAARQFKKLLVLSNCKLITWLFSFLWA